ncbi:hypothetical protein R1flu_027487 [Riccia fluitans]|uniref:MULE transposase domain-containing protein n=1 Tax=Riccia fluitans TaxID=41844 RepID=A0ABD1XIZ3_9MARC
MEWLSGRKGQRGKTAIIRTRWQEKNGSGTVNVRKRTAERSAKATATAVDGNNRIIVLAYGVAPVEDRDTWTWFVENLKASMYGLASPNVLIVSDRQKGLVDAVAEELPTNEHIHCAHHLQMNIRRHFGAQVSKFFQRLVYATSQARYEEALGILEKDYPNGKEAVAYIKAIDPRKFSRYALVLPRYGRVTSNVVECMNAAFLKLREYAARRLLIEVWIYVMRSFYERRTTTEGSIDLLTEYAKGRLSEFEREYGRYVTYNADDDNALVQTNGGVDQWIAPEAAIRRGRARTVRIPNGGGSSRRHREYMYPVQDEAHLISSQEAKNAWLNEFTGTLTSKLQTLRTEGTKAKLTGKVPDKDWLHEAKQRWRAHPTPKNLFRLTEALEEHEDQILVREKMFLKHAKYLTVTIGDEEAPLDISKAAVVLCRRNDVLYTSAERQEQLDRPITSFPDWNCVVSFEGGTINVPEQFRGGNSVLYLSTVDRPLGSLFDRYLPAHIPLGVLGADNAPRTGQVPEFPHSISS